MHKNQRALASAARQQRIAGLYLSGRTQYEIGEIVGINRSNVSRALAIIKANWLASAVRDFDAAKGEELARIDRLEREAWDAWERSKQDRETVTVEGTQVPEGAERLPEKRTARREGQCGDPRYLERVGWCIAKRCEIFGLDAPKRAEITGPGGRPIALTSAEQLTDDQLQHIAATGLQRITEAEAGPPQPALLHDVHQARLPDQLPPPAAL